MKKYKLDIPFSEWEQTGSEDDIKSRLLAPTVTVNGLNLHFEAIAVVRHGEMQCAADGLFEDDVSNYQNIQDTSFQTVEHDGREYIIVATPYGD